jgi:hypothetical protein
MASSSFAMFLVVSVGAHDTMDMVQTQFSRDVVLANREHPEDMGETNKPFQDKMFDSLDSDGDGAIERNEFDMITGLTWSQPGTATIQSPVASTTATTASTTATTASTTATTTQPPFRADMGWCGDPVIMKPDVRFRLSWRTDQVSKDEFHRRCKYICENMPSCLALDYAFADGDFTIDSGSVQYFCRQPIDIWSCLPNGARDDMTDAVVNEVPTKFADLLPESDVPPRGCTGPPLATAPFGGISQRESYTGNYKLNGIAVNTYALNNDRDYTLTRRCEVKAGN